MSFADGWIDGLKLEAAEFLWKLPTSLAVDARARDIGRQLTTSGCCVIPNFLDVDIVDRLAAKAEALYATRTEHVSLESNGTDRRIYGAERLDADFSLEGKMGWVDELSRAFYWSSKVAWFQMLGKITSGERNLGSGSGWHRDSPFSHQFKAIIYLSDVDAENGPFEYVIGSHLKGSVATAARFLNTPTRQYRFTAEQVECLENAGQVPPRISVIGKKGTLMVADSRGLHRGKPLQTGGRLAVTRYYFPRRIPADFAKRYPLTDPRRHSEK